MSEHGFWIGTREEYLAGVGMAPTMRIDAVGAEVGDRVQRATSELDTYAAVLDMGSRYGESGE